MARLHFASFQRSRSEAGGSLGKASNLRPRLLNLVVGQSLPRAIQTGKCRSELVATSKPLDLPCLSDQLKDSSVANACAKPAGYMAFILQPTLFVAPVERICESSSSVVLVKPSRRHRNRRNGHPYTHLSEVLLHVCSDIFPVRDVRLDSL